MVRQFWRSAPIRHDVPPIMEPARELAGYFLDALSNISQRSDGLSPPTSTETASVAMA